MSVLQALSSKALAFRRERDELAGSFQGVLAIAQAEAKARSIAERKSRGVDLPAVMTEADAVLAINRTLKQVTDTINVIEGANGHGSPLHAKSLREREALIALLPAQPNDEDLRDEARVFITQQVTDGAELNMKLMGPTMAHLTEKFGAGLDKGKASGIIKDVLVAK